MLSKITLILMALSLFAICTAENLSIIEIQKTINPGVDYTYPSPYKGQVVTTEGIVTSRGDKGSSLIYVSQANGGYWSGIAVDVSGAGNTFSVRDKIQITGTVEERFGMTVISNLSDFRVLSSHNRIPVPVSVTTYEVAKNEALESVFVKLRNNTVVSTADNRIVVKDVTGECSVRNSLVDFSKMASRLKENSEISISGIVTYSFGEFAVQPRFVTDITVNQTLQTDKNSWGRVKALYR